jgi:hypothetical protein
MLEIALRTRCRRAKCEIQVSKLHNSASGYLTLLLSPGRYVAYSLSPMPPEFLTPELNLIGEADK